MSIEHWTDIDRYITDALVHEDDALRAATEAAAAAGLPAIAVTPSQGKLLHLLARVIGARQVLEIGTLAGYSTIWMARALPPDGRIVTLEVDEKHAAVARENFRRARVEGMIELRVGQALDTLPHVPVSPPFDLVFIDADKGNIPEYFAWALRLTRRGGLIVIDNVIREGAVLDVASENIDVRGVRRLNEILSQENRVSATTIQTVGAKGHDGFTLALMN